MSSLAELTLAESHIEGACLEEPLETHTIPKLHWWLVCLGRDAPSSDKKPGILDIETCIQHLTYDILNFNISRMRKAQAENATGWYVP